MEELRLYFEISGFDRVLYSKTAEWNGLKLSVIDKGKAILEAWSIKADTADQVAEDIVKLVEKAEKFMLAVEWSYGHELTYKVTKALVPSFMKEDRLLEIKENLLVSDHVEIFVAPRQIPGHAPEVPLQAKRWIHIWVEATKLSQYVEEQLRRQYLIIEELWQDSHHIFNDSQKDDKKKVKLIRDFVSHARCCNPDIVALLENDLPTAIHIHNGKKCASFIRNVEHRNYISRYEVKSREIARELVQHNMLQFGIVNGVQQKPPADAPKARAAEVCRSIN